MQINNVLPIKITLKDASGVTREGIFPPSIRLYEVMRELDMYGNVDMDVRKNLGQLGIQNGDTIEVF